MSGWDAKTWANAILTGIYVLFGLALLLWPPKPGALWSSWQRLIGAVIIVGALVTASLTPGPTHGGLIGHGIMMAVMGLWFLLGGLWSVNGPDLPAGEQLRQRWKLAAAIILYGGTAVALGYNIPR